MLYPNAAVGLILKIGGKQTQLNSSNSFVPAWCAVEAKQLLGEVRNHARPSKS